MVQSIRGTPQERFDAKVDRNGPIAKNRPDLGRCHDWLAHTDPNGYGVFGVSSSVLYKAHRWAWEQKNGPVPEGLELDHFACDRRICCNDEHVRPVTHLENMARGAHALKTHCPQGHPYDEVNTILYKGKRSCRECSRDSQRRYDAAKRAGTPTPRRIRSSD